MTKSLIIKKEARFGLGYIVYVNGGCLISNEYFLIFLSYVELDVWNSCNLGS